MAETVDEHIGRQLLHRRRELGLTQSQLGVSIGVSLQQIQKYECAANRMSASRLWQLAEALDVPVTYFFEGLSTRPALIHGGRPDRAA
jgi:transcriptional regulator with XRE-family HTH domain